MLNHTYQAFVPLHALRSLQAGFLVIPRTKMKSSGNTASSYQAPLWNKLTAGHTVATSLVICKSRIKIYYSVYECPFIFVLLEYTVVQFLQEIKSTR